MQSINNQLITQSSRQATLNTACTGQTGSTTKRRPVKITQNQRPARSDRRYLQMATSAESTRRVNERGDPGCVPSRRAERNPTGRRAAAGSGRTGHERPQPGLHRNSRETPRGMRQRRQASHLRPTVRPTQRTAVLRHNCTDKMLLQSGASPAE